MAKPPTASAQDDNSTTSATHDMDTSAGTATSNGAAAQAEPGFSVRKIAGFDVRLPLKFSAGHILTAAEASILNTAYQRQFDNNQNALAKARAERYAAAKTEAERAANAPLTAEEIAALYADYQPNVGGEPRGSSLERMQEAAAWQVWAETVSAHNRSLLEGNGPVVERAGHSTVKLLVAPRKAKGTSDADHEAAVKAVAEAKASLIRKLLVSPLYADRIQRVVDAINIRGFYP